MILGFTGSTRDPIYVKYIDSIYKGQDEFDGYDIIVLNHRGLSEAPLTTPRLYCFGSEGDYVEALIHL